MTDQPICENLNCDWPASVFHPDDSMWCIRHAPGYRSIVRPTYESNATEAGDPDEWGEASSWGENPPIQATLTFPPGHAASVLQALVEQAVAPPEQPVWTFDTDKAQLSVEVVPEHDAVSHPSHYTSHPSGVECIQITRHMGFNLGNALKYIWRCDLKHDAIEDLRKAIFYLEDEIKLREAAK